MKKKGISPVVATILLVLITVIAVVTVANFIIPLVKENLEQGKSCFELREYISVIDSNEFSCYSDTEVKLMLKRKIDNITIKGIAVSIVSEGSSKRFDLISGRVDEVKMLNKNGEKVENIVLPLPGESKTYIFNKSGEKAEIAVIKQNEELCESESYNLPQC